MRERLELRAHDPVARCLIRRLTVPRIYFGVQWPGKGDVALKVDLLAIDRDGVGDAHVVEIVRAAPDALKRLPELFDAQAPFRWIAFLRGTEDKESKRALTSQEALYLPDTMGRIGVIEIVEMSKDELGANIKVKAERFPVSAYDIAMRFSSSHKANIQFGE